MDGLGRQILSVFPEGGETYSEYDDFSRPKNITNPIGELYTYEYNDIGLLSKKVIPNSTPEESWYDAKYRLVVGCAI